MTAREPGADVVRLNPHVGEAPISVFRVVTDFSETEFGDMDVRPGDHVVVRPGHHRPLVLQRDLPTWLMAYLGCSHFVHIGPHVDPAPGVGGKVVEFPRRSRRRPPKKGAS